MAKIDLTSPEWCELVFQGKNKAYGAYKMRANSPKRHTWAMVIVVIIAAVGFSIPTLVKLATPKQKEVMTEVTTLSQLEEPEVKQEEFKKVEPVAPPPALKSSIKFTAPVIKNFPCGIILTRSKISCSSFLLIISMYTPLSLLCLSLSSMASSGGSHPDYPTCLQSGPAPPYPSPIPLFRVLH